jgi:hypothetical protein
MYNNASLPRGAMVRAEVQRSSDPCIPGSNLTVDVSAGPSDETAYMMRPSVAVGVARKRTLTAKKP